MNSTPLNFYVGDVWRQKWTTRHPDTDDLVDPSTVTVTVFRPKELQEAAEKGTVATGESIAVTRLSPGEFVARVELTEAGEWEVHIVTTGEYEGLKPARIRVKPVRLAS